MGKKGGKWGKMGKYLKKGTGLARKEHRNDEIFEQDCEILVFKPVRNEGFAYSHMQGFMLIDL